VGVTFNPGFQVLHEGGWFSVYPGANYIGSPFMHLNLREFSFKPQADVYLLQPIARAAAKIPRNLTVFGRKVDVPVVVRIHQFVTDMRAKAAGQIADVVRRQREIQQARQAMKHDPTTARSSPGNAHVRRPLLPQVEWESDRPSNGVSAR
jgi:hypothetical protein